MRFKQQSRIYYWWKRHKAKKHIFWLVHRGIDFSLDEIQRKYNVTPEDIRELCRPHMGTFGHTAIFDRRIQLLSSGIYRCYGHYRNYIKFPTTDKCNPFEERLKGDGGSN